jgi:hypothetical protein
MEDEGTLVDRMSIMMHEDVIPWLYTKMGEFLVSEDFADQHVEETFAGSFLKGQKDHRATLESE